MNLKSLYVYNDKDLQEWLSNHKDKVKYIYYENQELLNGEWAYRVVYREENVQPIDHYTRQSAINIGTALNNPQSTDNDQKI